MLVVVAIIAILGALLLTALSRAEGRAHRIACVSNLKQFGLALQLYAGDNGDQLPPNLNHDNLPAEHHEAFIPLGLTWVEGWLGLPGPDCTNTLYLRRSLLGRYLGDPAIWHCPSAEWVTVAGVTQPRVRTVSLNCFMGAPPENPLAMTYQRLGEITQPSPAQALTFVDERVETINDATFAMQWDFNEKNPGNWILRDKPAVVHDGSGNLTFADGHVETHRWQDARTLNPPRDDEVMPGNQDVLWLQQHSTWRQR